MCDDVRAALAAGEALGPQQQAHLAGCATCNQAQRLLNKWQVAKVSTEVRIDPARLQATVRARQVRRGVGLALAAAVLATVLAWPRPAAAPEPDLFAVLDEADAVLGDPLGDPLGEDDLDSLFNPDFDSFDHGDL